MIDAVITDLELELQSPASPYGHFVAFRFIDTRPMFPKVSEMVKQVLDREDVILIDFNYTYKTIDENTDIRDFEVVRH